VVFCGHNVLYRWHSKSHVSQIFWKETNTYQL